MHPFPHYTTSRLVLRQILSSDIDYIFQGLSHPDVIRFYGVSFESLKATQEQMNWYANLEETKTGCWWLICAADGETFYGAGGLNAVSQQHKKGEIGFWLLPEHWGKGYMQEAMPIILSHGFEQMGLHRIEGFVESDNHACRKAIQKIGLEYEGTLRDCEIKDGRFISIDVFAKLSTS